MLEHFTLHRRAGWSQVLLLLAATGGDKAEDHKGDDRQDQDVEDLHALEAAAHEHGREQATGGDTGQRAQPARSTAGLGRGAGSTGCACGRGCTARGAGGWSHLAGLVSRCRTGTFAATEAFGVGVEAHRQADAQRHGDAKKTFHKGNSHLWIARAPCCTGVVTLASDIMFRAFA